MYSVHTGLDIYVYTYVCYDIYSYKGDDVSYTIDFKVKPRVFAGESGRP